MPEKSDKPQVEAATRREWRNWLAKHGRTAQGAQLVMYNKKSGKSGVTYEEAVEEALCFGWIDNKATKRDEESHFLWFAPRKAKSNWSQSNKERVERLIAQGLMTPEGQAFIDLAKSNGTWDVLDGAQQAVIPEDLQKELARNKKAQQYFNAFPPSSQRLILEWIATAKRPETRQKRITETVTLAAQNIRAHHPR
jgi:uncharacterized protein YdeI (YjbR/CyaY-like superfamily)